MALTEDKHEERLQPAAHWLHDGDAQEEGLWHEQLPGELLSSHYGLYVNTMISVVDL